MRWNMKVMEENLKLVLGTQNFTFNEFEDFIGSSSVHLVGTLSCLCVVAMTVTVVCVSFSHYVDGMIPIRSDRGSHCKHHLLETEV